jgi:cysteinyl-tRNA synthetase
MASAGFKEKRIDIHSGGEDLRFPHHDNEMAQSHACFKDKVWIRYFIHSGHLNIKGEKMSKSLKNFTSIKEALKEVSANTLRLYYAQTAYNKVMNFDPEQRYTQAEVIENTFKNFFRNCETYLRKFDDEMVDLPQKFSEEDLAMLKGVSTTRTKIDNAFKDNFNTPDVLLVLQEFVNKTNAYIHKNEKEFRHLILKKSVDLVQDTLYCMGMDYTSSTGQTGNDSMETELLDIITKYRNDIRALVSAKDFKGIFALNDKLRDEDLFNLGIKIDDKGKESVWMKCTKEELERERKTKADLLEKKKREKEKKEAEKLAKMSIKPEELFKLDKRYEGSQFDERGYPTVKKNGKEYSKKDKKYFDKQFAKQKKLYEQYLAKKESSN